MKYCEPCISDLPQRKVLISNVMFLNAEIYFLSSGIDMLSKSQKREFVEARYMTMAILNIDGGISLKSTGKMFGGYDHSTIIHAKKKVLNLCYTDPFFKQRFEELKKVMLSWQYK